MAVPEVNKKLLAELEAMEFPLATATRALYYSGNSSLEDAVYWIVDHENDPDINEMPTVPVEIELDAPISFDLSGKVKLKAEELRNEASQSRKEKEKIMQRELEKERDRVAKELQKTNRNFEENARKRMIALRQAEKEEERKAREKIRQKLESDKAERRSKLGLLPPISSSLQPSAQTLREKLISAPVTSTKKVELLSNCLRSMRRNHKDDEDRVRRAFQTLLIYVRNVIKDPDSEKFRWIRLTNPVFQERVGSLSGGIRFLELCGFERTNKGRFLYLPEQKVNIETLSSALLALQCALTNPYFGLLSVELGPQG